MRTSIVSLLACCCACSVGDPATQSTPDMEHSQATLICDTIIDGLPEVPPNFASVGDVVAFPSGTQQAPPQTPPPDSDQLFAKTGLIVRADSAFELLVPEGSNLPPKILKTVQEGW